LRDRYTGESKDQQTTGDDEDERCLQVDLSLNPLGRSSVTPRTWVRLEENCP
jgi:hypothetical protein